MSEANHLSLKEMRQNLLEEAEGLEKKIRVNLLRISEIDEYLDSIYRKEDADFKVFSPRNVEHVYKDDIDNHKTEKYKLESDNRSLYSKLNKVNAYLEGLDEAVKEKPADRNLGVLDIQEKERQRIARDLHDTSLQNLAHLVHKIELASMYIDKDTLQAKLELAAINKNLKAVIEEIRNTIFDLRPMTFDDLGLKESFERLFAKLKESNASFDFETDIDSIVCENDLVLMTIFRVVQEAASNAVRHSGGNKCRVSVKQKADFCNIMIKDNGSGFSEENITDKKDKHFGLAVMKERVKLLGGDIVFHSVLGEGTEIRISIPLTEKG